MHVDEVQRMYESGSGAKEIGRKFGKSVWQIYKFMKKHSLKRRSAAATNRIRFLRSPKSFTGPRKLNTYQKRIMEAGLMLYWAEGSKSGSNSVDLANSNPEMVRLFLKVLQEVYGVDDRRLRGFLYCYSDQDPKELIKKWSVLLNLPLSQFTKPYVRSDFKLNKTGKMPMGLLHVRYADTRLLSQIKQDIDKMVGELLGRDGGAVKHTSL